MAVDKPVRFGRYLLERRLAMGGMAEVFLGRIEGPEGFQKRVVLKRILPHLQNDANHVKMFLDEARLAARFDHPNLIQVYELARIEEQYCLAMEYIEGEDVAAILDESLRLGRRVPVEIACMIVAGAAEGLHYVHELTTETGEPLNVVHRDISPANIIVTWRGGVKIVDFGIAKHEISTSVTMAGTLKGKFSYMSPEQARGEVVDRRSDIFSLGTILYELLTVSPCFTGSSQIEILEAVTKVAYRPLLEQRPDVSPEVDRILKGMLTARRTDRYSTAEEVQTDLKRVLARTRTPTVSELGFFLSELFGRPAKKPQQRIPSAISDFEVVPVTDEFSSPQVIADESSYRMLLDARNKATRKLGHPGPLRGKLGRPVTMARLAAEWGRNRFWPTTLAIVLASLIAGASTLGLLYRVALGRSLSPTEVVNELVTRETTTPAEGEELSAGSVQLVTDPPGATVVLDGEVQKGTTPLILDNLAVQVPHRLEVEMDGYERILRDLVLTDAAFKTLPLKLQPIARDVQVAKVQVITRPAGAKVLLNGIETEQVTPAMVPLAIGREHTLSASLSGYRSSSATVQPDSSKSHTIEIALTRETATGTGYLDLDSEPNTEVLIDGRVVGVTPVRRLRLPAGTVLVQLRHTRLGLSKTLRLTISADQTLERRVVFRKGSVLLDVRPWADVYLGNKKLGTTPMPPLSLYEGSYALRLVNPDLGVERMVQVSVRAGKTRKITERLR